MSFSTLYYLDLNAVWLQYRPVLSHRLCSLLSQSSYLGPAVSYLVEPPQCLFVLLRLLRKKALRITQSNIRTYLDKTGEVVGGEMVGGANFVDQRLLPRERRPGFSQTETSHLFVML